MTILEATYLPTAEPLAKLASFEANGKEYAVVEFTSRKYWPVGVVSADTLELTGSVLESNEPWDTLRAQFNTLVDDFEGNVYKTYLIATSTSGEAVYVCTCDCGQVFSAHYSEEITRYVFNPYR